MTPSEIKLAERKYWYFIYLITAPLLLLLAYNTEISESVTSWLNNEGVSVSASTVALLQIGIELTLFFVAFWRGYCSFLARCPKCKKPIHPNNVGVVIATKHCTNCGAQVISDAKEP